MMYPLKVQKYLTNEGLWKEGVKVSLVLLFFKHEYKVSSVGSP